MSKNIIVCADGTWNDPEQLDRGSLVPTNVVKIARALALAKAEGQEDIFYDLGVGTGKGLDRFMGGLTGNGLLHNIFECYHFIAERYQPGDKIFLFGFSRGAYTVRSLAGLIGQFGIDKALTNKALAQPKPTDPAQADKPAITTEDNRPQETSTTQANQSIDHLAQLRLAYKRLKAEQSDHVVSDYKSKHDCYEPHIEMIGVWDTVGSLGIPLLIPEWLLGKTVSERLSKWLLGNYRFLNVGLNSKVKAAYHALSIDENRRAFLPTLWDETSLQSHQCVKQVWFTGIHSNVGGGYADSGLSDNALLWMVEQAKQHGLKFSDSYLTRYTQADTFYGEIRDERTRWIKRVLFQKGIRNLEEICTKVGIVPVIAESAIERQKSVICKKPYKVSLPQKHHVEKGF
ncbi:DUF2235 domain-containing protein [Spirosoma pollinicola]|uniref:T6SS Phospholipase effector Tle1-like catalytic domain-containing protein n=1 Tax=Spirosoma pollinicola TaxID=2057025 RepID=A0A2K8YSN6_9BACT|nr:DUF2235 domain-containing protein [Spirosoma pollinicola]AUD00598.1 hypothetical protein CWM47_01445 [Spirosoma pollinicola]